MKTATQINGSTIRTGDELSSNETVLGHVTVWEPKHYPVTNGNGPSVGESIDEMIRGGVKRIEINMD